MKIKRSLGVGLAGTIGVAASFGAAAANGDQTMASDSMSNGSAMSQNSTDTRFYIAPMVSFGFFDRDSIYDPPTGVDANLERDNDIGGTLAFGKPVNKWLNLELYGFYFNPDQTLEVSDAGDLTGNYNTGNGEIWGAGVDALFFPARDTLPVYALFGASLGEHGVNDPELSSAGNIETSEDDDFTTYLDAGVGYVYPITDYGISVRAEYRYRWTHVDSSGDFAGQHVRDADFQDHILSLGLQVPLGPPAEPVSEPAPAPQPKDSDGDGVIDANDLCPGTPAGAKVDSDGCQIETEAAPIELQGVTFKFDKSSLTPQAKNRLSSVVSALQASPSIDFRIDGYTDSVGSQDYNLDLSKRRVDSVQQYLTDHQINNTRISGTEGHGENNPVATNETAAGRAQNRRVELSVTNQSEQSGQSGQLNQSSNQSNQFNQ